jgi:UDP-perosamine 4-acetyltransferase
MRVALYGAGNVGKMVAYLLSYREEIHVAAVVDDNPATWGTEVRGVPVIGGRDRLPALLADGVTGAICSIGDNKTRGRLSETLAGIGFELINAIHPTAMISTDVRMGKGNIVAAGVTLYVDPIIGDNVYFDVGAVVSHDTIIADNALISAGVTIGARIDIGRNALVGLGASVMTPKWGQESRLRVGDNAIVGIGAVVIEDVPDNAVVVGVPAKIIRYLQS